MRAAHGRCRVAVPGEIQSGALAVEVIASRGRCLRVPSALRSVTGLQPCGLRVTGFEAEHVEGGITCWEKHLNASDISLCKVRSYRPDSKPLCLLP